jgi:hypothetical protein
MGLELFRKQGLITDRAGNLYGTDAGSGISGGSVRTGSCLKFGGRVFVLMPNAAAASPEPSPHAFLAGGVHVALLARVGITAGAEGRVRLLR